MPYKDPEKLRSYKADYARKRRENLSEEERQRIKQQRAGIAVKIATSLRPTWLRTAKRTRPVTHEETQVLRRERIRMLTRARIYREANPRESSCYKSRASRRIH